MRIRIYLPRISMSVSQFLMALTPPSKDKFHGPSSRSRPDFGPLWTETRTVDGFDEVSCCPQSVPKSFSSRVFLRMSTIKLD